MSILRGLVVAVQQTAQSYQYALGEVERLRADEDADEDLITYWQGQVDRGPDRLRAAWTALAAALPKETGR